MSNNNKKLNQTVEDFRGLFVHVHGVPVILDSDLARAYGTTTKALNQAVKRNRERFPDEFVFPIDISADENLKSQSVTSSRTPTCGRGVLSTISTTNLSTYGRYGSIISSAKQ